MSDSGSLLLCVLMMVVAGAITALEVRSSIESECKNFGAFSVSDRVYSCARQVNGGGE